MTRRGINYVAVGGVAISLLVVGVWWLGGGADPCPGGSEPDAYTPLQAAAVQEDPAAIAETIKTTGDPDGADCTGYTALMEAVGFHQPSVRVLLDHGAHVNRADEGGSTALDIALIRGDAVSATLLLDHGASTDHASDTLDQGDHVTPCEIGRQTLPTEAALLRRLCN